MHIFERSQLANGEGKTRVDSDFFDKQRLIFLSVQTERPVRTGESVVVFPFIGLYLPMGGLKRSLLYKIRGSGVFLTLFGTGILSFSL